MPAFRSHRRTAAEQGNGCPYVECGRLIRYRPEDVQTYIAAHVRAGKGAPASLEAEQKQAGASDDAAASANRAAVAVLLAGRTVEKGFAR